MKIQSNKSWYKAISTLIKSSINPPSIILSQQFLTTIPPRIYNVRAYIGPREYSRTIMNDLTVKHNVQQYCDPTRNFWNLSEKYQSTKQPQR